MDHCTALRCSFLKAFLKMDKIKVGIIQQSAISDQRTNRENLKQKISLLSKEGVQLIVLQELHDSLYFCQSENVNQFDLAVEIPGEATDFYGAIAKEHAIVLVTSLFEKRAKGLYHNTAVVFEKDGEIAGKYRKMHIPDDPSYYEKFYFTPGDLGFEPIKTSVGNLGVLVCWDQWYPEAARLMALKGADVLIFPTAIGYDVNDSEEEQTNQLNAWTTIQRSHAIANGIPVIAVNRCGYEAHPEEHKSGIQFWGNSFIAGPQGEFLLQLNKDEQICTCDIDFDRTETVRRWWPFLRDRRIDDYTDLNKRFLK